MAKRKKVTKKVIRTKKTVKSIKKKIAKKTKIDKTHPAFQLKTRKKGKNWYIVNVPKEWCCKGCPQEYGPYDTKEEAQLDIQGFINVYLWKMEN